MKTILMILFVSILFEGYSQNDSLRNNNRKWNFGIQYLSGINYTGYTKQISPVYFIASIVSFSFTQKWAVSTEIRYGVKYYNNLLSDGRVSFIVNQSLSLLEMPFIVSRNFYSIKNKESPFLSIGLGVGFSGGTGKRMLTKQDGPLDFKIMNDVYYRPVQENSTYFISKIQKCFSAGKNNKICLAVENNIDMSNSNTLTTTTFNNSDYFNPDTKKTAFKIRNNIFYITIGLTF